MAEGNGIDLGSIVAMLTNLVSGQESLRVGQDRLRAELMTQIDSLRTEMRSEFANVRSEFRAELRSEVADLRKTIDLYHGSVMGHGIAITELQDQVARINDHLGLSPAAE